MAFADVVGTEPLTAFKQLRERLRGGPHDIQTFLGHYRHSDKTRALRGLMLMAKFGLVAIDNP